MRVVVVVWRYINTRKFDGQEMRRSIKCRNMEFRLYIARPLTVGHNPQK